MTHTAEKLNDEVKRLEQLIYEIEFSKRYSSKENAHEILIKISTLKTTMWSQFPISYTLFNSENNLVALYFEDGKKHLEYYQNSKLKSKDDEYYNRGKEEMINGIKVLISYLQKEIIKIKNDNK